MSVVPMKLSEIVVNKDIRFVGQCQFKMASGMDFTYSNPVESQRTDCCTNAVTSSVNEVIKPAVEKL